MADSLNPQLVFASSDLLPFILDCPGPVDYNGARYTIANTQSPVTGSGAIQAATVAALGVNYAIGDRFTVNGGVHLAAGIITAIYNNTINGEAINSGGTGWAISDTFTVNGGSVLATGHVTSVSGGVVTGIFLDTTGDGYSVATGVATTRTSGAGVGLTINITSTINGLVRSLAIINQGTGYSVASGVATTATSGIGTGLTLNITQTGFNETFLSVFKSTDDGNTWVLQDPGHAPPIQSGGGTNGAIGAGLFYPKAGGNTFYLSYSDFNTGVIALSS